MSSLVQRLHNEKVGTPPKWLPNAIHYEALTGSVAFGVAGQSSDWDVVGFCIPPIGEIFPHTKGDIHGFGRQKNMFSNWQQHHLRSPVDNNGLRKDTVYDLTVYSIVSFFHLCMENNPNMVDSLFVPDRCILYITQIGQMVRENRKLFLHKGSFHRCKGYAYSQMKKMQNINKNSVKRQELIQKHGYDTKSGYHTIRLLLQAEQILVEQDLDLEKNSEQLKAIRRGDVSLEDIKQIFNDKEKALERLYHSSKLRYGPDEPAIKQLLIDCLETHYGSLGKIVSSPVFIEKSSDRQTLQDIKSLLEQKGI